MQTVIFRKLSRPSKEEIVNAVKFIIEESKITKDVIGGYCFIKINAMSREVLPGRNTSPWVLDAVLNILTERFPSTTFVLGDSHTAGYQQFYDACRNWGYNEIAKRYGVKIVNLSEDRFSKRDTDNPLCRIMELPETILKADSIINVPVIKTHVLSGITCCLKNHWGMLPGFRYQYHVNVSEIIAEINRQISKTVLNIVDGTICIEGSGPKTGKPKICSVLFGGTDRVAVDSAVIRFMDIPPDMARHIALSEAKGVGITKYRIVGDAVVPDPFERPRMGGDLVSLLERVLRKIPFIGKVLYRPSIARILGLVGTKYNEMVWFNLHGKKYIRQIIINSEYKMEFENILRHG